MDASEWRVSPSLNRRMLDPRVRTTLMAYQRGTLPLESAALALLAVRRATGCLDLMAAPEMSPTERRLIERYAALVREAFPPDAAPG